MKKFYILIITVFILAISIYRYLPSSSSSKKVLRVMTYSSFLNIFGPGEHIKKEFEKICACHIKWIRVTDSTLFIQRLHLKKDGFKTDVVLGLDQLSLKNAELLPWKNIIIDKNIFTSPAKNFVSHKFIPYDWSPMSFISKIKRDKINLKDLLNQEFKYKISLPYPRTSTVGFQFYYWIWSVFKNKTADFLKDLKSQLYGMSPSWSISYALFQRGHVLLSFSYLSSLLYHAQQKQKDFYAVSFKQGHPFQVELAGVSGFCTQCELAQKFVHFLLTPAIQQILYKKNYMLPVTYLSSQSVKLLFKQKLISYKQLDTFLELKKHRLDMWDKILK